MSDWVDAGYKSTIKKIPMQGYKCGYVERWALYSNAQNFVVYVTEALSKGLPSGEWTISLYPWQPAATRTSNFSKIAHRRFKDKELAKRIAAKMLDHAVATFASGERANWERTVFADD